MEKLQEELKTIKNLCEIAQMLITNKKVEILPTVLEVIYIEAQQIVDEQCIRRNND